MKPAILVSLCILAIGFAALTKVISGDLQEKQTQVTQLDTLLAAVPTSVDVPVFIGKPRDIQELSTLSASAVHVEDRETGTELYSFNDTKLRYPASTAKMMTAIVARKVYTVDTPLTIREEVFADGSNIGFEVGERITVRNLLAVLLIHSGNDAAFVLANNAPGGYDRFIELTSEILRADRRYHTAMLQVMADVNQATGIARLSEESTSSENEHGETGGEWNEREVES